MGLNRTGSAGRTVAPVERATVLVAGYARPYLVVAAGQQLQRQVRVGDVRSSHSHQIGAAVDHHLLEV
jgi:hypothetical protein